jgi:hypothetical protein
VGPAAVTAALNFLCFFFASRKKETKKEKEMTLIL